MSASAGRYAAHGSQDAPGPHVYRRDARWCSTGAAGRRPAGAAAPGDSVCPWSRDPRSRLAAGVADGEHKEGLDGGDTWSRCRLEGGQNSSVVGAL